MRSRNSTTSKRYLSVPPALMPKPMANNPMTGLNPASAGISQRGLLSVLTVVLSLGALTTALAGGGKLILDILNDGMLDNLHLVWAKSLVLVLAYIFGWLAAAASIRIYGNLILPAIIRLYGWAALASTSILYLMILQRLFKQSYDLPHYWAYILTVAAGLAALVGLHLIPEEHDLRPFSIPLLLINLIHLGLIVIRYVFIPNPNARYLWGDLFFFGLMLTFSGLMLAHLGLLTPLRQRITRFCNAHSPLIRAES